MDLGGNWAQFEHVIGPAIHLSLHQLLQLLKGTTTVSPIQGSRMSGNTCYAHSPRGRSLLLPSAIAQPSYLKPLPSLAHPGAHLHQLFYSVTLIPQTFRCLPNLAVT